MDIVHQISLELRIAEKKIARAVELLDAGSTVPFIARYRKEVTGALTDTELRALEERLGYLRNLDSRKQTVLTEIDGQGKLTEELSDRIDECLTLAALEDLYRPYKPKKETRGSLAVKRGLGPLAVFIRRGTPGLKEEAAAYVDEEKGVPTPEAAVAGALDIIAEEISDNANYRVYIKKVAHAVGAVSAKKNPEADTDIYDTYADYEEKIKDIKPHRILAVARGTRVKALSRTLVLPTEDILAHICSFEITKTNPYAAELASTVKDAYDRLIYPSVANDIFGELFERAEDSSISVFKSNLRSLLLEAPLRDRVIMGFDPGYRTGCKVAVIDRLGQVVATDVLFATLSEKQRVEARRHCLELIGRYGVEVIALGNGTASRESEKFLADVVTDAPKVRVIIVSEAGASVYSASKLGEEEFPDYDVALRSAVSIARRLQDPLAELVKIDPMAIGVGQYQHDMNPKKLREALTGVIEDAVNLVGVDLNSASPALLSYVSGISATLARRLVEYRYEHGRFHNRLELLKVKGFGPKSFENAAGFLRVDGDEPLDKTAIHPESYPLARSILAHFGVEDPAELPARTAGLEPADFAGLAQELGCGEPTLADIVGELGKPYRDPRDENRVVHLDSRVTKIEELTPGMVLEGTVRNIMDFGCFVDIGVHTDGLVHISELCERFVRDVSRVVRVGQIVKVSVIDVDVKRRRISLSMKRVPKEKENG